MSILLVIGILVFLIVAHEFGHFIAAKWFGVRVEEFGIGYPPRAFTFGRWGGTEYTLNWLPFGGFVRLFGDIGEDRHGQGSFIDKGRGVQAVILVAGVFMNAVAAWLLFTGAYFIGIPHVVDNPQEGASQWLLIADVVPGSPASVAGMTAGDRILEVASPKGEEPANLTPDVVGEFISARGGQALEFSFLHAGATTSATVRPAHAVIPGSVEKPAIGVSLVLVSTESMPFIESVKTGFISTKNAFVSVTSGLGTIAKGLFSGGALRDVVGPVGLVGVVGNAAENGIGNVFALAAFISVNLVIINLLPIPALDGGRLFILGVEAVLRRKSSRFLLRLVNAVGIAFIVFLMVSVTYNDIVRLFA